MKPQKVNNLGLLKTISDEREAEMVMKTCALLEEESNRLSYSSALELKQRVLIRIVDELFVELDVAERLYRVASNSVLPYLRSGEEMLKARSQLDYLTNLGQEHLIRDDGTINEKLFGFLINAIKVRHDIVSKTQANLVSARRAKIEEAVAEGNKLNLDISDRDQLERYLREKLLPNPSVAAEIIRSKNKNTTVEVTFDEGSI